MVKHLRIKEQTFLFEYGNKLLYHKTGIFFRSKVSNYFDTLDRQKKNNNNKT